MSNKVVKFGGSSLADANQFKKVAAIIKSDDKRRYVVRSAPGKRFSDDIKVTDMLYKCCELASSGMDFSKDFQMIKDRYNGIISELGIDMSLDSEFDAIVKELKARPTKDFAASRGEYLNGKVLAKYLDFTFVDAADVIIFDTKGSLLLDDTVKAVRDKLKGLDNAVIPGFYGRTTEGFIKTFSRGGSDVTGSIIANAVKADIYENWTDVSGFLVADPRIVDKPDVIEVITYRELRELAYMGASVLHEDAIFPVRRCGIPINIRNTNMPEDEGTWIVESTAQKTDYVVTGIAGKKDFCTVFVTKAMMNAEIGFGRKVLQAFEENGISFEHMPSGIDTMTIVVHADEFMHKEQKVISAIHRLAEPDSVEIESGLALIAVVGRGMKSASGTAGKLFTALAKQGINIRMIDQGSSELNIIIGVKNSDFETAIKAIYATFIGE